MISVILTVQDELIVQDECNIVDNGINNGSLSARKDQEAFCLAKRVFVLRGCLKRVFVLRGCLKLFDRKSLKKSYAPMTFELNSLLHSGYQEPLTREWQQDGSQITKKHLMVFTPKTLIPWAHWKLLHGPDYVGRFMTITALYQAGNVDYITWMNY